jgi:hypothetical protein
MSHRSRAVDNDVQRDVLLLKVALDVELIASTIEVPVNSARVIAYFVLPVLSELNAVPTTLRAVGSLTDPKERALGTKSKCV